MVDSRHVPSRRRRRARFLPVLLLVLTASAPAAPEPTTEKAAASLPGGARFLERDARLGDRTVRLRGVFFTDRQARLAVIDNAAGASLGEAMVAAGAIAGVNGGYFHADNAPVGLMIAGGKRVHAFERAKLLSGVFVVTKGRPRIVRSARFTPAAGDSDALQAGPFLVEGGKPVAGLNAQRSARRTVIATDGAGRWALLLLSPVTLAEAGEVLAAAEADGSGFRIAQALNLDGGSSSGLWAGTAPHPFYAPEFTPGRNFVAVLPR